MDSVVWFSLKINATNFWLILLDHNTYAVLLYLNNIQIITYILHLQKGFSDVYRPIPFTLSYKIDEEIPTMPNPGEPLPDMQRYPILEGLTDPDGRIRKDEPSLSVSLLCCFCFRLRLYSYFFYPFNLKFCGRSCWNSLNQFTFICNICFLMKMWCIQHYMICDVE